jgi:hypothetical protein
MQIQIFVCHNEGKKVATFELAPSTFIMNSSKQPITFMKLMPIFSISINHLCPTIVIV